MVAEQKATIDSLETGHNLTRQLIGAVYETAGEGPAGTRRASRNAAEVSEVAYYPVYATLRSFGTYSFAANSSYLLERPMALNRPRAALLGQRMPADGLSGGVGAYATARATWIYWIIAPQSTALSAAPGVVEAQYNMPDRAAGYRQHGRQQREIQTLTVYGADGSTQYHCQRR